MDKDPILEAIKKAYPYFLDSNLDDFTKCNIIREWVAKLWIWTTPPFFVEKIEEDHVDYVWNKIKTEKVGGWCGHANAFLGKIYLYFGWKVFFLQAGFPRTSLTHLVVLVEIKHNGIKKLIIEDAYLNLTYVDKNGNPLGYFEIIDLLKNFEHEKILEKTFDISRRAKMKTVETPIERTLLKEVIVEDDRIEGWFSLFEFREKIWNRDFKDPKIIEKFEQSGHPADFKYIYLSPFIIKTNPEEANQLLKRMHKYIKKR